MLGWLPAIWMQMPGFCLVPSDVHSYLCTCSAQCTRLGHSCASDMPTRGGRAGVGSRRSRRVATGGACRMRVSKSAPEESLQSCDCSQSCPCGFWNSACNVLGQVLPADIRDQLINHPQRSSLLEVGDFVQALNFQLHPHVFGRQTAKPCLMPSPATRLIGTTGGVGLGAPTRGSLSWSDGWRVPARRRGAAGLAQQLK